MHGRSFSGQLCVRVCKEKSEPLTACSCLSLSLSLQLANSVSLPLQTLDLNLLSIQRRRKQRRQQQASKQISREPTAAPRCTILPAGSSSPPPLPCSSSQVGSAGSFSSPWGREGSGAEDGEVLGGPRLDARSAWLHAAASCSAAGLAERLQRGSRQRAGLWGELWVLAVQEGGTAH